MNPLFIPTNEFRVEAFMNFHPSFRAKYGEPVHTTWKVKRKVYILGISVYLWYSSDNHYSLLHYFVWEDKDFQKMVKPYKKNDYSNIKQVFFR